MIEREFIKEKAKYLKVKEFIENNISKNAGVGDITIEKTPLGEKITISAVRPGLIIGSGGQNISRLTRELKFNFKLDNPQLEIKEIENPTIHASVVARKIASDLERYGAGRFKVIGYRTLQNVLKSGVLGVEIRIGGRGVPGQKARSWLFYGGYMKKCGDVAMSEVDSAISRADLRSGTVGIKVKIMSLDIKLPDKVTMKEMPEIKIEEINEPVKIPKKKIQEKPTTKQSPAEKPSKKPEKKKEEAKKDGNPKST